MKIKFDLSNQEGVLAALVAVRNSTLDNDKKNELRDIIFRYTKSDNDSNLREKIEALLETLPLPKNYSGRLKGPKKQSEAIEDAGFAKKRISPKFSRRNEYKLDSIGSASSTDSFKENTVKTTDQDIENKKKSEAEEDTTNVKVAPQKEDVVLDTITTDENDNELLQQKSEVIENKEEVQDVNDSVSAKESATAPQQSADEVSAKSDESNQPKEEATVTASDSGATLIDQVLQGKKPKTTQNTATPDISTKINTSDAAVEEVPKTADVDKKTPPVEKESDTPAPPTTPDNQNTQPTASESSGQNDLARVREIKQWVNDAVGNPVNIVSKDEHAGRRYMTALLAAMQSINSETQRAGTSEMSELEAAFEEVKKVIEHSPETIPEDNKEHIPTTPESDKKQPSGTAQDISQSVTENNASINQPNQNVAQKNSFNPPHNIPNPEVASVADNATNQNIPESAPTQNINDGSFSVPPVSSEAPIQKNTPPAESAHKIPVQHKEPAPHQTPQQPGVSNSANSRIPNSKPIPDLSSMGVKEPPHFSPEQVSNHDHKQPPANNNLDFSVNGFPISEPEGVVISDKKSPDEPIQSAGIPKTPQSNNNDVTNPSLVKPPVTEQTPPATSPPIQNDTTISKPEPSAPQAHNFSVQDTQQNNIPQPNNQPATPSSSYSVAATQGSSISEQLNNLESEALKKNKNLNNPLYSPEIDNGLNQLLLEWSLFKSSGLFGTGPNGREHPLFKQLSPLMVSDILASKFEGARPEIIQSITDYMNGWRYEQGIVYKQGESFEQYLRRVIRFIIDNKK